MADTHVTLVGNLTDDVEVRFTQTGTQVGSFRLAVTPRIREGDQWKNGETSYFKVNLWRDLASHAVPELAPGSPEVVLVGVRG
jgi:single-strand DNA-binding protein